MSVVRYLIDQTVQQAAFGVPAWLLSKVVAAVRTRAAARNSQPVVRPGTTEPVLRVPAKLRHAEPPRRDVDVLIRITWPGCPSGPPTWCRGVLEEVGLPVEAYVCTCTGQPRAAGVDR